MDEMYYQPKKGVHQLGPSSHSIYSGCCHWVAVAPEPCAGGFSASGQTLYQNLILYGEVYYYIEILLNA